MTIQDLGSIGELVAAFATVLTLIYLAIQIGRNASATHSASFHAISDSMNQINLVVAQNSALSRIWLSGVVDRDSLPAEDRHQLDMLLLSYFHVFETLHYQASKGTGDGSLVITEEKSLVALLSMQGIRQWWFSNPVAFSPEFRNYIEGLIPVDMEPDA